MLFRTRQTRQRSSTSKGRSFSPTEAEDVLSGEGGITDEPANRLVHCGDRLLLNLAQNGPGEEWDPFE